MSKVSIKDFKRWKVEGRRIPCLTAYDAPTARLLAAAEIPLILVGDSVGNVVLGYRDTVRVTMEEMLHHCRAVRRGAPDAFVVGDMPFLSFHVSPEDAVANAGRFLKEGIVDAVKLEGGAERVPAIQRIIGAGVPVMGHLGLTPQSATMLGGNRLQGTRAEDARKILEDAERLAEAGVFALVLEMIPREVAQVITERIDIPTIGIGAGPSCNGQVLVLHDMLGIGGTFQPRFVRRYAELDQTILSAVESYVRDVRERGYPGDPESFHMPAEELRRFLQGDTEAGVAP